MRLWRQYSTYLIHTYVCSMYWKYPWIHFLLLAYSFNRLYSSASPGAAGVVEVVPRTQQQQPRNIRHSRNSNKIGDMSDTMLSSSMNSWMYQSQSNNSEEMKRSNLIHTASNLTRKLIALDKDSDMKTEAKRRKSSQIRFWWNKPMFHQLVLVTNSFLKFLEKIEL